VKTRVQEHSCEGSGPRLRGHVGLVPSPSVDSPSSVRPLYGAAERIERGAACAHIHSYLCDIEHECMPDDATSRRRRRLLPITDGRHWTEDDSLVLSGARRRGLDPSRRVAEPRRHALPDRHGGTPVAEGDEMSARRDDAVAPISRRSAHAGFKDRLHPKIAAQRTSGRITISWR
jgi:hypothetical protein